MRTDFRVTALAVAVLLLGACAGPTDPNGAQDGGDHVTGYLRVTTVTNGALPDVDGYVVTVDGDAQAAIQRNQTVTFPMAFDEGAHEVELTGIAENCELWSANPQSLEIVAGDTAAARFQTQCVDPRALRIAVATSGSSFDADGYTVIVDGEQELAIDINDDFTLYQAQVPVETEVELKGVAPNCALVGTNPQTVTGPPSTPRSVLFHVSCDYVPGEIAYTSERVGHSGLYTMNADGAEVVRVTSTGLWGDPAWSPDGTRIALAMDISGWWDWRVYVMDADGTNLRRVTPDGSGGAMPAWSPDGARIAYESYGDIWVVDADGANPVRLTNDAYDSWGPAWSPDGTRIAFTRSDGPQTEIAVMRADGSEQVNLTRDAGDDSDAAWSPDGTRLAFTSDRNGNREVYVMRADGSHPTNLTDDPGADHDPAWSPDGGRIAFATNRDGNLEIYVMNVDGSNVFNLTRHPASDGRPAWSR